MKCEICNQSTPPLYGIRGLWYHIDCYIQREKAIQKLVRERGERK